MPKKAHLSATQILKFLCLYSGAHSVVAHLMTFMTPVPEMRDCWRTQDLVKIGYTLQTGIMANLNEANHLKFCRNVEKKNYKF